MTEVRFGVLRLVDSAPALVAAERGIFADLGVAVSIQIESSWANLADKLARGLLDAASILPPLALAAAIGVGAPQTRLIVPMALSQGGNAVVLGTRAIAGVAAVGSLHAWLRTQPERPRFGVVHAFSTHNLLLRYWLAASGADPVHDIETVAIAPEDMVEALADGRIAAFCAGAPWGGVAEQTGAGQVLIGTSGIWPHHPEKCLAVGEQWAAAHPAELVLLLRGLLRAQILCDQPAETPAIAAMLAREEQLLLPEQTSLAALAGGDAAEQVRFQHGTGWFAAPAHALWFLDQMQRWGWIEADAPLTELARTVYRPDLLAPALVAEGLLSAPGEPQLDGEVHLPPSR